MNKKETLFWEELRALLESFNLPTEKLKQEEIELLITAFTHKSYSNEHKDCKDNDYLEFIGDGILQFILTDWISSKKKWWKAGLATQLRSSVVDKTNLANIATKFKLMQYLRHSKTAFINGLNKKTISNLYESFVGAIYIVYGLSKVREFTNITLKPTFDRALNVKHNHPKNLLQEHFQKSSNSKIEYITEILANSQFGSVVMFENVKYGEGIGKSKKDAETNAAIDALEKLGV
ncbi:ribonuclease III family protein [Metamycoplasma phocicerebrale]|uniref:Ribonuclease 3 n=1 Tax=Metamycoplasma phocicerebrale TaxID=142649 RepID=A0A3T0TU34_9BACT|nr:ribonuclease III domain-containing protein [Metamycoplasma phocicerebrale]AZZ65605.1 ribonuclease III family protein [Metamycoplasma phocicerebrale]